MFSRLLSGLLLGLLSGLFYPPEIDRSEQGNNITHNLIVNGGIGIYNHGDTGEITCNNGTSNMSWHGTHCLYRASGGGGRDFVAGTEGQLHVRSWSELNNTLLARRWPSFGRLMGVNSTHAGWASAAGSNYRDNVRHTHSAVACGLPA